MPTLVPGAGDWTAFNAVVAALAQNGSGKYSDCTALGRWDLVPYQTIAASIKVGIVAAHGYGIADFGIDKVDFYLEGGDACSATASSENADVRAGFYDFNVTFDPTSVDDGLVEIRAIVYPVKGYARVFSGAFDTSDRSKSRGEYSMFINANADDTLVTEIRYVDPVSGNDSGAGTTGDPFLTVYQARVWARTGSRADGLHIKVRAGNIEIPPYAGDPFKDYDRWLVIEPDDGVARSDVHVATAATEHFQGLGVKLLQLKNLTIDAGVNITQAGDVSGYVAPALWFDTCERNGGNIDTGDAGASSSSFSRGIFETDSFVHHMNTAFPFRMFALRNTIEDIGEDVYRDFQGLAALNTTVRLTQPGDNHSDLCQSQYGYGANGLIENVIFYMEKAKAVGITGETPDTILIRSLYDVPTPGGGGHHKDFAWINCDYTTAGGAKLYHSVDHLLIWHCTWAPHGTLETGGFVDIVKDPPDSPDTEITNLSLQCSVLNSLGLGSGATLVDEPTEADTSWADNNHVISGVAPGTNLTTGGTPATLFVSPTIEDTRPNESGPLVSRTNSQLVPVDLLGTARFASGGAIGAYEQGGLMPPIIADKTITFQFDHEISVLLTNTGDVVTDCQIDDPTHAPNGIAVSVSGTTVRVFGTPVRS